MTAVLSFGFISQETGHYETQINIVESADSGEGLNHLEWDFVPRVVFCGEHQTYRCESGYGMCSVGGQVPCAEFREMISPY